MKINVEIDITPEEVQELFIPGEKQAEFFTAIGVAYAEAVAEAGLKLSERLFEEPMKWLKG